MRSESILVVTAVILFTSSTSATLITANADLYDDGVDISTAFPDVTLSTIASRWNGIDGKVYARIPMDPSWTTTGDKVFGNSSPGTDNSGIPNNESWWRVNTNGRPFIADKYFRFRADFHELADYVAIDVIGVYPLGLYPVAYKGMLEAYSSDGTRLAYVTTPNLDIGQHFR